MQSTSGRPLIVLGVAALVLSSTTASRALAADPAVVCEAKKLNFAGLYAACRLKAESKALKKGLAPDYAKCDEKLATQFAKAEKKAGPGVCPTEGDVEPIGDEATAATTELAGQLAAPDPACPPGYRDRTPSQVVADTMAALNAADEALLACNYHPNAFLSADQGVFVGPAEIVDYLIQFPNLFQAPIEVNETQEFRDMVRILYEIDGGWIVINDGTDTFIVRRGRIRQQSQHALIEFTGPPPEP